MYPPGVGVFFQALCVVEYLVVVAATTRWFCFCMWSGAHVLALSQNHRATWSTWSTWSTAHTQCKPGSEAKLGGCSAIRAVSAFSANHLARKRISVRKQPIRETTWREFITPAPLHYFELHKPFIM